LEKTINFSAGKNQLKKGFPGACFLRFEFFNGSFDTKKRSFFTLSVAVFTADNSGSDNTVAERIWRIYTM
jgi:hypothetical protein